MTKRFYRKPPSPIKVFQPCTGEWIPETEIRAKDVSEDMFGRDVVIYECPRCGEDHQSLRLGGR